MNTDELVDRIISKHRELDKPHDAYNTLVAFRAWLLDHGAKGMMLDDIDKEINYLYPLCLAYPKHKKNW